MNPFNFSLYCIGYFSVLMLCCIKITIFYWLGFNNMLFCLNCFDYENWHIIKIEMHMPTAVYSLTATKTQSIAVWMFLSLFWMSCYCIPARTSGNRYKIWKFTLSHAWWHKRKLFVRIIFFCSNFHLILLCVYWYVWRHLWIFVQYFIWCCFFLWLIVFVFYNP